MRDRTKKLLFKVTLGMIPILFLSTLYAAQSVESGLMPIRPSEIKKKIKPIALYSQNAPDLKTGGYVYTVDLTPMPMDRNGNKPKVELRYNSLTRMGRLGPGWDLNVSCIKKSIRTGIQHASYGYVTDFIWEIEGQELVFSSNGPLGYEFVPKKDDGSMVRVYFKPGTSGYEDKWIVYKKDGSKMYYGDGQTSGIAVEKNPSGNVVSSYCLTETFNSYGSGLVYSYQLISGVLYPVSIDWGHGHNVSFEWKAIPDAIDYTDKDGPNDIWPDATHNYDRIFANKGYLARYNQRLTKITVLGRNETGVATTRVVNLSYKPIKTFGRVGAQTYRASTALVKILPEGLPATEFEYHDPEDTRFNTMQILADPNTSISAKQYTDEFSLASTKSGVGIYNGNSSPFENWTKQVNNLLDVDGDGDLDIVSVKGYYSGGLPIVVPSYNSKYYWRENRSQYGTNSFDSTYQSLHLPSNVVCEGDVSGTPKRYGCHHDGLSFTVSHFLETYPKGGTTGATYEGYRDVMQELRDMNGDGAVDLVFISYASSSQYNLQVCLGRARANGEREFDDCVVWADIPSKCDAFTLDPGLQTELCNNPNFVNNRTLSHTRISANATKSLQRNVKMSNFEAPIFSKIGFEHVTSTLMDINADGLVDRVKNNGTQLIAQLNTGSSFISNWDYRIAGGGNCVGGYFFDANYSGTSKKRPIALFDETAYFDHPITYNEGGSIAPVDPQGCVTASVVGYDTPEEFWSATHGGTLFAGSSCGMHSGMLAGEDYLHQVVYEDGGKSVNLGWGKSGAGITQTCPLKTFADLTGDNLPDILTAATNQNISMEDYLRTNCGSLVAGGHAEADVNVWRNSNNGFALPVKFTLPGKFMPSVHSLSREGTPNGWRMPSDSFDDGTFQDMNGDGIMDYVHWVTRVTDTLVQPTKTAHFEVSLGTGTLDPTGNIPPFLDAIEWELCDSCTPDMAVRMCDNKYYWGAGTTNSQGTADGLSFMLAALMDFDGDGRVEFLTNPDSLSFVPQSTTTRNSPRANTPFKIYHFNETDLQPVGVLKKIKVWNGMETIIDYSLPPDKDGQEGTTIPFPIWTPMLVQYKDTRLNKTRVPSYYFREGKYQYGEGSVFGKTEISTGLKSVFHYFHTDYAQNPDFWGLKQKTEIKDINLGQIVQDEVFEWESVAVLPHPSKKWVRIKTKTKSIYSGSNTHSRDVKNTYYDCSSGCGNNPTISYGLLKESSVNHLAAEARKTEYKYEVRDELGSGTEMYIAKTGEKLIKDIGNHVLGWTIFYYDSLCTAPPPSGMISKGDLCKKRVFSDVDAVKHSDTFYQYDSYGRLIKTLTDDINNDSKPEQMSYTYHGNTAYVKEGLKGYSDLSGPTIKVYNKNYHGLTGQVGTVCGPQYVSNLSTDKCDTTTFDKYGRPLETKMTLDNGSGGFNSFKTLVSKITFYDDGQGANPPFIITEYYPASGGAPKKTYTYFNVYGQSIMSELVLPDNKLQKTYYEYDNKGLLVAGYFPTKLTAEGYNDQDKSSLDHYQYLYNPVGQLTKVVNPDNTFSSITRSIDSSGNLIVDATDESGQVTKFITDIYNDTISKKVKLSETEWLENTYKYDSAGRLIKATDPENNKYEYTYYDNGKLKRAYLPNGIVRQYKYTKNGSLLSIQKGDGAQEYYHYDSLERLTKKDSIPGSPVTLSFSGYVNGGETIKYGPYWVVGGGNISVSMTGTKNANLFIDKDGGQVCASQNSGSTESCSTSGPGEMWVRVKGVVRGFYSLTIEYDPMSCSVPGPVFTYTYGNTNQTIGQLTKVENEEHSISYKYNVFGKVTKKEFKELPEGLTFFKNTTYNNVGQVTQIHYPDDQLIYYSYDIAGRLTRISDNHNKIHAAMLYHNDSTLQSISGKMGHLEFTRMFEYDGLRRTTQINTDFQNGSPALHISYGYHPNSQFNHYEVPQLNVFQAYGYDLAGRLQLANGLCRLPDGSNNPGCVVEYNYYKNSALMHVFNGTGPTNYIYDAGKFRLIEIMMPDGEFLGYRYDSEGKRCTQEGSRGHYDYQWTPYGNLKMVLGGNEWHEASYNYTHDNQRWRVISDGEITFYFDNIKFKEAKLSKKVALPGGIVCDVSLRDNPENQCYFSDLKNAIAVYNGEGELVQTSEFFPNGQKRKLIENNFTDIDFSGNEREQVGELVYFGARYFDPIARQWLSPDPLRLKGAQDTFKQNTLQPYVFAASDPISKQDLDGHDVEEAMKTFESAGSTQTIVAGYDAILNSNAPLHVKHQAAAEKASFINGMRFIGTGNYVTATTGEYSSHLAGVGGLARGGAMVVLRGAASMGARAVAKVTARILYHQVKKQATHARQIFKQLSSMRKYLNTHEMKAFFHLQRKVHSASELARFSHPNITSAADRLLRMARQDIKEATAHIGRLIDRAKAAKEAGEKADAARKTNQLKVIFYD